MISPRIIFTINQWIIYAINLLVTCFSEPKVASSDRLNSNQQPKPQRPEMTPKSSKCWHLKNCNKRLFNYFAPHKTEAINQLSNCCRLINTSLTLQDITGCCNWKKRWISQSVNLLVELITCHDNYMGDFGQVFLLGALCVTSWLQRG